jgi:hypothetical protein
VDENISWRGPFCHGSWDTFSGLPIKCAYQVFIIQNLYVVTLKLDIKVQFANF